MDSLGSKYLMKPLPVGRGWNCSLVSWTHKDRYYHDEEGKEVDKKERILAVCCDFIQNPVNRVVLPVLALTSYDGKAISENKLHPLEHHVVRTPLQEFTIKAVDNSTKEDLTSRFQSTSLTLLFTRKRHAKRKR